MSLYDDCLSRIGLQMLETAEELRHFIQCYWFIKTEGNLSESVKYKMIPDGGTGILFNYSSPFCVVWGEGYIIVRGERFFPELCLMHFI